MTRYWFLQVFLQLKRCQNLVSELRQDSVIHDSETETVNEQAQLQSLLNLVRSA